MSEVLRATDFLPLEEVLAMPSGEKLDRLAVFLASFLRPDREAEVLAGRPSENIAAAWVLLESELEAGGHFSTHVDGWLCRIGNGPEVIAQTAPLAICRAIVAEAVMLTTCDPAELQEDEVDYWCRQLLDLKKIVDGTP
jgi:hypothetical protein